MLTNLAQSKWLPAHRIPIGTRIINHYAMPYMVTINDSIWHGIDYMINSIFDGTVKHLALQGKCLTDIYEITEAVLAMAEMKNKEN